MDVEQLGDALGRDAFVLEILGEIPVDLRPLCFSRYVPTLLASGRHPDVDVFSRLGRIERSSRLASAHAFFVDEPHEEAIAFFRSSAGFAIRHALHRHLFSSLMKYTKSLHVHDAQALFSP